MNHRYQTARLFLDKMSEEDAPFIRELVNTEGWQQFIGKAPLGNIDMAKEYLRGLLSHPAINYWVVKLQEEQTPIGIITFVKRDNLAFPDLGFAFLPAYVKQGFAFEAASSVLQHALQEHPAIFAITVAENRNSIQLLEKLGFRFDKEMEGGGEILLLYTYNSAHLNVKEG